MRVIMQKYIRTKDGAIIVFPQSIQHDTFKVMKPVSAGFIFIDKDGLALCQGESITLDLVCGAGDSETATCQFFGEAKCG